MQRLRISARTIHRVAWTLSVICGLMLAGGGAVLMLEQARAQRGMPERIATVEVKADNLASTDARILQDVAAIRADLAAATVRINGLETTVASWKFTVTTIGTIIGLLNGLVLLTKGRLYVASPDENHGRRNSGGVR